MRKMAYKPVVMLGNGASVSEEAAHYIHHLGNQLMILMMVAEVRAEATKQRPALSAKRRKAYEENKKARIVALRQARSFYERE